MRRKPDRTLLALLPPLVAFIAFGALRVDAPISLIGLLFDSAWTFAAAAVVVTFGGAALLYVRPIERRVAGVFAPSRAPTAEEEDRLRGLLDAVGRRAALNTANLVPLIHRTTELNAAAGAVRLLFVTEGALRREDAELEALLAHELGHHRGLHPLATTVVWWLAIPGEVLARVYLALRRIGARLRVRPVVWLVTVALVVWQLAVMWVYYVGKLLTQRAARISEFITDAAAVEWGYGPALLDLYRTTPDREPAGRLARLLADHPPITQRIARIEARAAIDGPALVQ
ncbi:M48 family metalloprotease [Solirubrobacter soli]|uniref:M48 family metalloprotease n=1 Tax=Solirubrobacter soli TaxID=363832 RepID=UPI000416415A|nr:M48 family metalloprotease [Solirubrobacter soli]